MKNVLLYASCVLLVKCAVAQIPDECRRPPPITLQPQECCRLPQVFSEDELERCGFEKQAEGATPPPPPPPPQHGHDFRPPPCEKQACLLSSRGMARRADDGEWTVDREAVGRMLDAEADRHPDFASSFARARQACLQGDRVPGPPHVCEPVRTIACVSATVFAECPSQAWGNGEKCDSLRSYINTCKQFIN